jgi:hypothetical protein
VEISRRKNGLTSIEILTLYKPFSIGAPRGIRTPDLRIRSARLYPAELVALIATNDIIPQFARHANDFACFS